MRYDNDNPTAVMMEIVEQVNGVGRLKQVRVELTDVKAFHAEKGGWVKKVIFKNQDGTEWESWGKSWIDSETREIVRVGAGAYGDMTVWSR